MLRITVNYKRRIALLLILVLIVFFLLPELRRRSSLFIERPVLLITVQIQKGITYVSGGVVGTIERIKNISKIELENKRLQREIDRLKEENRRLQEAGQLNKQLREMLGFKRGLPYKTLAARITGRDPSNWYKTVIIDRGESDGVKKDMGVIVPSGVVGRVIKSAPGFSQVLLITDIESATAVLIERTRNEGILEGRGFGTGRVKYIPLLSGTRAGDLVLTSGLAGGLPRDLMVGKVNKVVERPSELFQDVEVVPAVDFNRIEEVLVITSLEAGQR
ncbi:MAG: rod shape-determining protein MreC [Nitrospirota bacterium]